MIINFSLTIRGYPHCTCCATNRSEVHLSAPARTAAQAKVTTRGVSALVLVWDARRPSPRIIHQR